MLSTYAFRPPFHKCSHCCSSFADIYGTTSVQTMLSYLCCRSFIVMLLSFSVWVVYSLWYLLCALLCSLLSHQYYCYGVLRTVSTFVGIGIRECRGTGESTSCSLERAGISGLRSGWANQGRTLWISRSMKGSMMDEVWPFQRKDQRIRVVNSESCRYRR